MKCRCCGKDISEDIRRRDLLQDYCDAVCYAAGTTLTTIGLKLWRLACSKITPVYKSVGHKAI